MNPSVHTDDARFLELLERWLTGEFNRSDEGELYALTTADPFRKEAWEGFLALPEEEHQVQIDRLRRRLRPPQGRRILLGRWMAAAAALVLLLAAFYFIPDWRENADIQPIAQTNDAVVADSIEPFISEQEAFEENQGLAAEQPLRSAKSIPPAYTDQGLMKKKPGAGTANVEPAKEQPQPFQVEQDRQRSKTNPIHVGGPDNALQNAAPVATSPEPGRPADKLSARKDSQAGVVVATNPPKLSKAENPPDEVVEDETVAAPIAARTKAPAKPAPTAQPVGGWEAFHLFINRNARLPEAARNNNVSGKVRLQFTVDSFGKPTNIIVLQALGYGCDEEAKRLIDMFQWTPPGSEPLVVDIPFVR